MPTILTHAAVGLAVGRLLRPKERDPRFWWAIALLPVLPDADVVGFRLGVHYGDPWGHRGATHSLLFALLLGAVGVARLRGPRWGGTGDAARLWATLALAAATHGLLDALTDGGLGVALLWPFDDARLFAPFRPVAVAPIGLAGVLTTGFLEVLAGELLWIWLPAGAGLAAREAVRATRGRPRGWDGPGSRTPPAPPPGGSPPSP